MDERKEFITSEELLMIRIKSMNLQVAQAEKQKNKLLRSFYQLELKNSAIALERKFEGYCDFF